VVLFLLNGVFDTQQQKRVRSDLARLLKLKLEEVKAVIGAFMPLYFFTMMEFQREGVVQAPDEMVGLFLDNLDANYYESLFVVWNSELKEQQYHRIRQECERVMASIAKFENDLDLFDAKISLEQYIK